MYFIVLKGANIPLNKFRWPGTGALKTATVVAKMAKNKTPPPNAEPPEKRF